MEKHLTIEFDDNMDPMRMMQGWVIMWPDGYVLAVDVVSMERSERTGSYMSEFQYPKIFNSIYAKMGH